MLQRVSVEGEMVSHKRRMLFGIMFLASDNRLPCRCSLPTLRLRLLFVSIPMVVQTLHQQLVQGVWECDGNLQNTFFAEATSHVR